MSRQADWTVRVLCLTAVSVALLLAGVPAASSSAATALVKGRIVGGKGMTVAAVATDGTATTAKVGSSGRFTLKLKAGKAKGATLQLIEPSGSYFGPVVLANKKQKAYTALKGRRLDLGSIKLRKGYATPAKPVSKKSVDSSKSAQASKKGAPIGAAKLGLVRSSKARASGGASGGNGGENGNGGGSSGAEPGVDSDRDGLPNALDSDDNGNLILDAADPATAGSGATTDGLFSTLVVDLAQSLNANAGTAATASIDSALATNLGLVFYLDDRRLGSVSNVNIDCFALTYCRRGAGTATISGLSESRPDLPRGTAWTSYDTDSDGLPNIPPIDKPGESVHAIGVIPGVTSSQISPGDTYNIVSQTSAGTVSKPLALSFYFVTTPALKSYDNGGGVTEISYPIQAGTPGTSSSSPITLTDGTLTLTFWRPQRAAIAGAESGDYIDMGHLQYGITLEAGGREVGCPSDYSNLSSTLRAATPSGRDSFYDQLFPLEDTADDTAPNPSNTLSFKLDVAGCLARNGVTTTSGMQLRLPLTATDESRAGGSDRAVQTVYAQLP